MSDHTFPVEAGQIMLFARAVGDTNPIYYDAQYAQGTEPGGIIAPPTFARSSAQYDPDYLLRPKPGVPWFGSGKTASGLPPEEKSSTSGGLHAEQHYTYHRHIQPGDVLTVHSRPGESWVKQGRRSGALCFSETIQEYRDAAGALVITARSVSVITERPVTRSAAEPQE